MCINGKIHPPPYFFPPLKILMISDKTIHKAFRIHKILFKNKTYERFCFFNIYQYYTLSLTLTLIPP